MDNNVLALFAILFRVFLGLSAALIIWMFVSLVHLGDERRQQIVGKACTWTLIATGGGRIIDLVCSVVQAPSYGPSAPFVQLTVTALMYAVFLGWFKRKYGG